jgi:excisionase family DNA binding protein
MIAVTTPAPSGEPGTLQVANMTTAATALQSGDDKPCLSTDDAAALLGVSKWLLLQETKRGNIPHKRVGRRLVYSRQRLLDWVADGSR